MSVQVDVAPDLFEWAVERAGWDQETIERRAPKFDDWVAGGKKPTLKQLEKFAHDTHTPFGLLFLPEPPVEEIPIPDMRTFQNKRIPRPSADLLDTIYVCQDRQDWYQNFALENGLERLDFVGSVTTSTRPQVVADQIRNRLGFDRDGEEQFSGQQNFMRQLIDRIENLGVLVMVSGIVGADTHRKLNPEEFRGFSLADPLAPLIFVNGTDTKSAQVFTLIHELGHIWLGSSALSDTSVTPASEVNEEQWCNQVAAEVLVPGTSLRSDYRGEPSTDELERLAKKYQVSTLVVLKRLFEVGQLSWETYQECYQDEFERVTRLLAEKHTKGKGGNYYNTQLMRLGTRFARSVVSSTLQGSTTYRDAYQLLGSKKHKTFTELATKLGVG